MSALSKFNPFRSSSPPALFPDLGSLENRLEKFLGQPLFSGNGGSEAMTVTQWAPLVDITEDDKEYVVKAELPELKKEEVKVTVENGQLTISGERKFEKEEKNRKYHRVERAYGTFVRAFSLPETVNAEKVAADFKDGVLNVHLPKDEKARPRTVQVSIQ